MLKIKYDIQKIGVTTSPIGLLDNQNQIEFKKSNSNIINNIFNIKFKHIEVRKCFIMFINDDTCTRTCV